MRFLRVGAIGAERPVARLAGRHYDLSPVTDDITPTFLESGRSRVDEALRRGELRDIDIAGERIGAPIARPGKIVCIGLNYSDHARETGAEIPTEPVVFFKDPATVIGPFDEVLIPRGSRKTDWEIELGIVMGRAARYLSDEEDALAYVAGYVVSHDVSEREFQLERGGQWDKGKSCETFNPLGPELVTPDEVGDVHNLAMTLSVNNVLRQDGTTANMIFRVGEIIRYLSQFMVLYPGDLINTGTPAGVALGLPGQPYLRAGDVVELQIQNLGRARQVVSQA